MHRQRHAIIALATALLTTAVARAGDLNPPAGPIGPTMKTLTEIEPRVIINATNTPGDADSSFKITQPGSYYLTGNITGVAGKSGIEIVAPHVTIDLNGFELLGVAGSLTGIAVTGSIDSANGAAVRNGSLRDWDGAGIYLSGDGSTVDHVRVSNSLYDGISLGNSSVATDCVSVDNGGTGFSFGFGVSARNCAANGNAYFGFSALGGSIQNCISGFNASYGYNTQATTLANCSANENGQIGFSASGGSELVACTAIFNGTGTSGIGIYLTGFGRAHDCIANTTYGDNFVVSDNCQVEHCTSVGCSNRGFWLVGAGARIEGCHAAGNLIGYALPGSGNVVIRNTARGNTATNYSVPAPGAGCGAIINAASAPINNSNSFANIEF